MTITLCLDFGNTRLKYAIFEDADLKQTDVLEDADETTIRTCLDRYRPAKTILSSVIDHHPGIEKILEARSSFHKLGADSKLPFTTPVGKRETIGADRLALLAGANLLSPGHNNLVIGLGSAITYNYLNKYREFIGGGISPGLEMRFKSLQVFTAKLPLVKAHWNFPLVGYDTKTNIQSGVIMGMAKEIDGTIAAYEEKYSNLTVLMSGGDSRYFAHLLKKDIITDPDLIFKGLYAISEYNK